MESSGFLDEVAVRSCVLSGASLGAMSEDDKHN